jgi:V/A-type H+-transporting ATPase subunit A
VIAVQDDLVALELNDPAGRLIRNELVLITPSAEPGVQLAAEILRVRGRTADAQVFEPTAGISIGDKVLLTGEPLSATLGPGLLGQVYDGLQRPLEDLAQAHGVFLPRGVAGTPLPLRTRWPFRPTVAADARVAAGDLLGWTEEGRIRHAILAPFDLTGRARVLWIEEAAFTVEDVIGELEDDSGRRRPLGLAQRWPVRQPLGNSRVRAGQAQRRYPDQLLTTGQRIIDCFFPVARGGTACIPGPFGAGKTILQNLIARFSEADVVIMVACGERAGEVVEMMGEFAHLTDPRGGGALMERTIIICNTSAMPVAARETSVHMGATLAEYYREMGLDVLLLADSTSRWAQALRETSGRLEEIPGEEAYPAALSSEIKAFYGRAGVIERADGTTGSLTLIGAVSPAGGNFEEPVTQATLATVKCFLGLSSERAYRRCFPAIDPLLSWSRYGGQVAASLTGVAGPDWSARIARALDLLRRGDEVAQMMKVAGEEGVTLDDAIVHHKAQFLDAAFLQQDAFDAVDAANALPAQIEAFGRVEAVLLADVTLSEREAIRRWFSRLTAAAKAILYAAPNSAERAERARHFQDCLAEGVEKGVST